MMVGIMKHKPMTFFGPPLKQPRISIKKVHPSKTNGWNLRKMETPNWKRSNIYLHKPPIIWVRSSRLFSWLKKNDLTKTRVFFGWNVHGATAGWIAFQWMEPFLGSFGRPFLEVGGWSHLWQVGGGFKYFLNFHPEPWGNDPIWRTYFSDGLV